VDESATEWEKPQEGQKDGKTCDNFRVDEASLGSITIALIVDAMQVIACNASYDGCKSKLKNSQHLLKWDGKRT
jgi:hypothetical protein